jgi:Replication protein C C-terminal region
MVLDACPAIADWTPAPIRDWPEFIRAATVVRAALGVSPSAWQDAVAAMGEPEAAVCVVAILQRAEAIKSPGGYLRVLTDKARAGQFSLGPVLMALLRAKLKGRASGPESFNLRRRAWAAPIRQGASPRSCFAAPLPLRHPTRRKNYGERIGREGRRRDRGCLGIGLASAEAMLAAGSRVVMVDRDAVALLSQVYKPKWT